MTPRPSLAIALLGVMGSPLLAACGIGDGGLAGEATDAALDTADGATGDAARPGDTGVQIQADGSGGLDAATDAASDVVDGSVSCANGYSLCDGACVDLTSNANSCGGCGATHVCSGGTPACVASVCVSDCPAATPTLCAGVCVDTASNVNDCGTCATHCPPPGIPDATGACVGSACTFTCNLGFTLCNGACVDLTSDANNCGGCGATHACSGGTPVCTDSACVSGCPLATPTLCGGACVDTTSSANDCGMCTNHCPAPDVPDAVAACVGSVCTFTCNGGYTLCDGACVDFESDDNNCGGCGSVYACSGGTPKCANSVCVSGCPAGTPTLCGGLCVDTMTSLNDCGACANRCTTSVVNGVAACVDGMCSLGCSGGYSLCNDACVDYEADAENCGGCGASYACSGGTPLCAGSMCCSGALPPSVNVDSTGFAGNFASAPTWNCTAAGTTIVDSTTGALSGDTCDGTATLAFANGVAQTTSGGPTVMVVLLAGLTVTNDHVIQLVGDDPIVFLVAGNVLVDLGGTIDAGASGTTAGPGGSLAASCAGSTGVSATSAHFGGGGGGFGTAGGFGSNDTGASAAAGGAASASTSLQPLRGGCSGGTGGNGAGVGGAGGGAFEISVSGTITIGTGSNVAILSAEGGGSPAVLTGANVGSGGAGSGGGILLVSPAPPSIGVGGATRAHGGGSGASQGCSCNPNTTADDGANGHLVDNTPAAGGATVDPNSAAGANGGVCAGNGCAVASAPGSSGTTAQVSVSASGGGGGGGQIQIMTAAATVACN